MDPSSRLRSLPSVDRLARQVARAELAARRQEILGEGEVDDDVDLVQRARRRLDASLRPVLNATGVILHTNLGRARLSRSAVHAVHAVASGYSNLELDLRSGRRGSRDAHVASLLCELTGAEDALVVNNGAAAVLLAASVAAPPGSALIVSRGELVEIGGGFRIPEIVAQSGARLVEVGTTNRTDVQDYARAVSDLRDDGCAVLRVHQSNFRAVGFVSAPTIEELCDLDVQVVDDVGSGRLLDALALPDDEPSVTRSIRAGAAIVIFSGDKLLGGPQAGVMVGTAAAIEACRTHPLARALRIDKLSLAALEATLTIYRDPDAAAEEVPALSMLSTDPEVLQRRAAHLAQATGGRVVDEVARTGGGALPLLDLPGPVAEIDPGPAGADGLAAALRDTSPPILSRVRRDRVLLDPRTLDDRETDLTAELAAQIVPGSR